MNLNFILNFWKIGKKSHAPIRDIKRIT